MKKIICTLILGALLSCNNRGKYEGPDSEGSHWDYSVFCEGGFKYKTVDRGAILLLNSDGTPLRCDKKRY
jgi:hypothetical protein